MIDNEKLVLIGLDGATYSVLRPLVAAGAMPTVGRFMKEGACATLHTTRPPVTCPAWPTLFTGVNPGKHGVFSFSFRDRETKRMRTASLGDVHAPSIWDMLSQAGRRVGVLNVPITFPAHEVPGAMLTGFVSPDDSDKVSWPVSLRDELIAELGPLNLNWAVLGYRPREIPKREQHIRRINELMAIRVRQFESIAKKDDFDFYFFVHEYTDRVQHLFYHILDPEFGAAAAPQNQRALALLREGHKALDDSLAQIVARFGGSANYAIVSDHGFGAVTRWVYINNLLQQHGLVSLRGMRVWGDVLTRKLNVSDATRRRIGLEQQDAWHRQDPTKSPLIDYARSRAFAGPQLEHGIYVNAGSRFEGGSVKSDDDVASTKREIIEVLSSARDPETDKPVFEGVWAREDLYAGDYVSDAPDVIYELAPGYMASNSILPPTLLRNRFLRPLGPGWDISGYHRPEGVFIGWGPAFRRAEGLTANILDVAPTVLHIMGLPVPSYMDGRVITDVIKAERLTTRPPEVVEQSLSFDASLASVYSESEQAEVTRRLEDLGYI